MSVEIGPSLDFFSKMAEVLKQYDTPKNMPFSAVLVDHRLVIINPVNGGRIEYNFNYMNGMVTVTKRTYTQIVRTIAGDMPYMDQQEEAFDYGTYGHREMATFTMYLNLWAKEQIRA